jgi:hypothetical protein
VSLSRFLSKLRGADERRRFPRAEEPAMSLVIDGRTYLTKNWSLGGFWIADFAASTTPGDRLAGALSGRAASTRGEFVAEVVWVDGARNIGLRLLELDGVKMD